MSGILGGLIGSLAAAVSNSYESIATVTVGTAQSSISFTSIPSTYKHLQIRGIGKWTFSSSADFSNLIIAFNSDTASNYSRHGITGNGSTAATGQTADSIGYTTTYIPGSVTAYNNMFSAQVIDILDYANTNKYKTIKSLGGMDTNSSTYGYVSFGSVSWRNTAAITSISLTLDSVNFAQYSQYALYGIKG